MDCAKTRAPKDNKREQDRGMFDDPTMSEALQQSKRHQTEDSSSTDEHEFHDAQAYSNRCDEESTIGDSQFLDASEHTKLVTNNEYSAVDESHHSRIGSSKHSRRLNSTHFRRDEKNEDVLDFVFERIEHLACTMDDEPETIKDILDEVFEYLEDVACGEIAKERSALLKDSFERFLEGIDQLASLVPKEDCRKTGKAEDLLDIVCQHIEKSGCKSGMSGFLLGHLFDKDLMDDVFAHIETGTGCKRKKKSKKKRSISSNNPSSSSEVLGNLLSEASSNEEMERINQSLFKISEELSQSSDHLPTRSASAVKADRLLNQTELSRRNSLRKLRGNIHGNISTGDVLKKAMEYRDTMQETVLQAKAKLEALIEKIEFEKLWDLMVLGAVHDDNDDIAIADLESLSVGQSHGFISAPTSETENLVVYRSSFDVVASNRQEQGKDLSLHTTFNGLLGSHKLDPEEERDGIAETTENQSGHSPTPHNPKSRDRRTASNFDHKEKEIGRMTPDSTKTEQTCDETLSVNSSVDVVNPITDIAGMNGVGSLQYVEILESGSGQQEERAKKFNRTLSLDGVLRSESVEGAVSLEGGISLGPHGYKYKLSQSSTKRRSPDAPGSTKVLGPPELVACFDDVLTIGSSFEPEVDAEIVAELEAELEAKESEEKTNCASECISIQESRTSPLHSDGVSNMSTPKQSKPSANGSMMSFFSDMDSFDSSPSTDSVETVPQIPNIASAQSQAFVAEKEPHEVVERAVVECEIITEIPLVEDSKSQKCKDSSSGGELTSSNIEKSREKLNCKESHNEPEEPRSLNHGSAKDITPSLVPKNTAESLVDSIASLFTRKKNSSDAGWFENNFGMALKIMMLVVYVGMKVTVCANESVQAHFEERKERLKARMLEDSPDSATSALISVGM